MNKFHSDDKIFVTGGAGFIGSTLVKRIIQSTEAHVVNIDSLSYASNLSSLDSISDNERYFFEKVDLNEREKLKELFKKYNPSYILNLAAESHVDRSIDSPDIFMKSNVFGTFNLLEEFRSYINRSKADGTKEPLMIHISTDEVFGDLNPSDDPFDENSRYDPSSPYSASKASSDHLARAWIRTYNLPIIISNCSNNYGPFQFPEKLIPHMILNAIEGNNLPIYGDGNQIRDWLYVEDHVEALLFICLNGKQGETYCIGGNNEMRNIDIVNIICDILDSKISKKPNNIGSFKELISFVKDRPGHDKRYAINNFKIKDLGWSPDESFKSGISKTIEWYLNNSQWHQEILNKKYSLKRIGDSIT